MKVGSRRLVAAGNLFTWKFRANRNAASSDLAGCKVMVIRVPIPKTVLGSGQQRKVNNVKYLTVLDFTVLYDSNK